MPVMAAVEAGTGRFHPMPGTDAVPGFHPSGDAMSQVIHTAVLVGGGLLGLFMILLAMPQSKFRDFLMPIVGWCFALFCGAYILSPVDLVPEMAVGPFGLIDDARASVASGHLCRPVGDEGQQGNATALTHRPASFGSPG